MSSVATQLEVLRRQLSSLDTSGLDADGSRAVVAESQLFRGAVDAQLVAVTQRINELAVEGLSADAEGVFLAAGRVSAGEARREARRAGVATELSAFGDALRSGAIGGEHVDVMAGALRGLDADEREHLVGRQAGLVEAGGRLDPDGFRRHVRRVVDRVRADHGLKRAEAQWRRSCFRSWVDRDGMGQFRGSLDSERFAVLAGAIEREVGAMAARSDGGLAKNENLAAAALVELVSHGNGRAGRPHVTVVVDADTALSGPHEGSVCETDDGSEIPPHTVDRFCCDAVIRKVMLDERGVPIAVGRTHRTATAAQWAALKVIYSSCAWAGCDRPLSWTQAHHIREWEHGGSTDLDNLVPLCNRHHHAVHEGRWTIKLLADRTLRIHQPDGTCWAKTEPDRLCTSDPPPTTTHRNRKRAKSRRRRRTTDAESERGTDAASGGRFGQLEKAVVEEANEGPRAR